MQFPPARPSDAPLDLASSHPLRRYYRRPIRSLAYVNLDNCNGGILRNLGEGGAAVQAIAPLRPGQQLQLRFELLHPRLRLEAPVRVVWTDRMGQAGLEFLQLSPRLRRALKDWIFTQLLAACHSSAADSIFAPGVAQTRHAPPGAADAAAELDAFSPDSPRSQSVTLSWFPFPIAATVFSRLTDVLVLVCAVLLFTVLSLSMIRTMPNWPVALLLLVGAASAFAAVYWFLFEFWIGATPGEILAGLALSEEACDNPEDDRPRFR
jgi:PilZ domain